MNDLLSRLKNVGVLKNGNAIDPKSIRKRAKLDEVYNGEWQIGQTGDVFLMEEVIPLQFKHGNVIIRQDSKTEELFNLFNLVNHKSYSIEDFVFLDIETSSLSFGAGSFVFLIGLCYFSRNGLHTKLLFIDSPGNESELLILLDKILSEFPIICSYNGKTFDLPFVRNRFRIHKLPYTLDKKIHVDLLHTARRLWKGKLDSCKLSNIENSILAFKRDSEEIPGWLVPQIYYDFLSNKDVKSLGGVFYHNRMDVISLSALTIFISNYLTDSYVGQDFENIFRIAGIFEKNANYQSAKHYYELGINNSQKARIPGIFHRKYGLLLKKLGNYENANQSWKTAAEQGDYNSCIELAKYLEHREKNFRAALKWAEKGKFILTAQEKNEKKMGYIDHRIERLSRKIKNNEKQTS